MSWYPVFVDFNLTSFLVARGLPPSTTDLSTGLALQLLEHLQVETFFNDTACDRASFTGALPSGFVKGLLFNNITISFALIFTSAIIVNVMIIHDFDMVVK